MPEAIDKKTGAPVSGTTSKLMATLIGTPPSGVEIERTTIYFNASEEVPLRPAMNEASVETQKFQNGDSTAVDADSGYQSDTITTEYDETDYNSIDAARSVPMLWKVQRIPEGKTEPTETGLAAVLTVSSPVTVAVGSKRVPVMSVTIAYVGTKKNPLAEEVAPTAE
jgi:hypothetical protein